MQCQPPKQLPEDLQEFMDGATEGVLYVSFGSVLQGSQVPKDKKDALLKVFGTLKEKVLMKWESDHLDGKPDNMVVRSFLPQQVRGCLNYLQVCNDHTFTGFTGPS